ncbi:MAG: DUF6931 family protein [Planctomycetota bacterium]
MVILNGLDPQAKASMALGRVMDGSDVPAPIAALSSTEAAVRLAKEDPRMAIRLIAGWLSTREAVWYAALCLAQVRQAGADIGDSEALARVVKWVKSPDGPNTEALAANGRDQSPASLLARAVLQTRDNISPAKSNPVAPKPGMANRLAAMAILGAAARWPGKNRGACVAHLVELGLDVAECLHLWEERAIANHPGLRATSSRAFLSTSGNIWENWK